MLCPLPRCCARIAVLHSKGCGSCDFGQSKHIASDGVLRFKLNWGMHIMNVDDGTGVYALANPGTENEAADRFLCENKFFHITKRGIELCEDA